jgi:uncharacterized membrane protein YecN with MAPEG domain
MSPVVPHVAAIYAAVLGLLACVLTVRVILGRVRTNIQAGDGGDLRLGQSIRAHANFAEQAPLALLVIVLAEMLGVGLPWIHALGGVLVLARLISAWGLSSSLGATPQRQAGAGLTIVVLALASLMVLYRALVGS